jgi:hypothetical protein
MNPKYLTKSKFKTAYACPRKLYYLDHKTEYGNKNDVDEFLKALAEGGFQVGGLAKCYFKDGIDLEGLKTADAIAKTNELLKQDSVTIFEAALNVGPYLVLVDILKKSGDLIELFEVKAKSFDIDEPRFFKKKEASGILSKWEEYIVDIAYQTWVAREYFKGLKVLPYLTLVNTAAVASVDKLHQNFKIIKTGDRTRVEVSPKLNSSTAGDRLLIDCDVSSETSYIINQHPFPGGKTLPEYAKILAYGLLTETKLPPNITPQCKNCEFKIDESKEPKGLKSGFLECWIGEGKLSLKTKDKALIFDIWHSPSKDLLPENITFLEDVREDHFSGLRADRQWLQVKKYKDQDPTPSIDKGVIESLLTNLDYPLHFIDFETSMVAVPFHKGRRPYEQIAFQFSHHVMEKSGLIRHESDFIHLTPGEFPNFQFLRALKNSLSNDTGSIFRYATHENTVLRQIRRQLQASQEPDQKELIEFIDHITKPTGDEEGEPGKRNMIDLLKVVTDGGFYQLSMGGSNSIKKVIPAVLSVSDFLKEKYKKPIYGKGLQIESRNFKEMVWVETGEDGEIKDPYKKLPPLLGQSQGFFNEHLDDEDGLRRLFNNECIKDGGAAMTAWARMQFTEMSDQERADLRDALLRYCELDTLSMVWLMEYFLDLKL